MSRAITLAAAAAKSPQLCLTLCDHRQQLTRLPHPWDSPGKNTGVGCRFLLQCMKVKTESEVAQSCPALSDPMDCSPSGFSIHGIFQARVLEWGAIAFLASLKMLIQSRRQAINISEGHTLHGTCMIKQAYERKMRGDQKDLGKPLRSPTNHGLCR